MLRVGLTGELGSGKSTVARLLGEHGAVVLSSDAMARTMMQRGEPVYEAIVDRFGSSVLLPDGALNRRELARLAFEPSAPRVEELNAIIHPAVFAQQATELADFAERQPDAVVVIESALLLTTRHAGEEPWRKRFDRIVLVTAPEAVKVDRFVRRAAGGRTLTRAEEDELRHDAQARLAMQQIPAALAAQCTVLENAGDLEALKHAVDRLWTELVAYRDESGIA